MTAGDIEPADPGEGLVPVLLVEQGADDGLARGRGLHPLLHTDPRHHDQEAPAELVGRRAVLGVPGRVRGPPGAMLRARGPSGANAACPAPSWRRVGGWRQNN